MFKNILSLMVILSLLIVSDVYAQDDVINSFTFDNNCQVDQENPDQTICEGYEQVWLEFSCYRGNGGSASLQLIDGQAVITRISDCVRRNHTNSSKDKVVNHKNDIILHVGVINVMWDDELNQFSKVMFTKKKYYTVTSISSDVERKFLFRIAKERNNGTLSKKNVKIGTNFESVKLNKFTFKNMDVKSVIHLGMLEVGESVYVNSVNVYSVD